MVQKQVKLDKVITLDQSKAKLVRYLDPHIVEIKLLYRIFPENQLKTNLRTMTVTNII
jgi:hypothetical protein